MELSLKIDIIDHTDTKDFNNKYFHTQTPVVIKGLAKKTEAWKKWSIDYFKDNMGDLLIDVYDNANKKTAATAYTKADLKMKFRDYLEIISKDEHTDLRIFLYNLFKHNSSLHEDFPCPEIFKGTLDQMGYMFFGGKGTTVRIHYDIDMSNVLHTHFGGRKRVILIAPEYSELLYRLPLNTYSLIDIDHPNYEKYPALKYVKGYEIILEPGDSIFMPAGYWHYMTYLEGSFSVSYRKLSTTFSNPAEGLVNLGLYMPLDKMLNWVLGKTWLERKNSIAQKNANNIIHKPFFNPANTISRI
jgi:hypothetical protein